MLKISYTYNEVAYPSSSAVLQAMWADRKAIPVCTNAEEWARYGVTYEEEEIPDPTPTEPTPEQIAAQKLAEAKNERAKAVSEIKVTVGDKMFDGDEQAQSRMARALQVAEITGMESTVWVVADNTVATVTVAEMKEALSKSMLAMGELWTVPYQEKADETEEG